MASDILSKITVMAHRQFMAVIIICIWSSCNKVDIPDPVVEPAPVFFTDLSTGSSDFKIAAGKDNYFMDARYELSEENKVLDLIGILRPEDCRGTNCRNSLLVAFRYPEKYDMNKFDIGTLFSKRIFSYAAHYNNEKSAVKFEASSPPENDANVITWKFDDEKEIRNRKVVEKVLENNKDYRVRLQIKTRSCTSAQLQTVNLTTGGCRSLLKVEDGKIRVRSSGKPPFKYQWSNGSTDSLLAITNIATIDRKEIRVRVTDNDGCVSESMIGMSPGASSDHVCEANFGYSRSNLALQNASSFGKARIKLVDEDGVIYQSNIFSQNQDAKFEILEISDFESNSKGQKTKKLKIELACTLYGGDDMMDKLDLKGTCTIAVAHP